MTYHAFLAAAALAVSTTPALAQGVSGGQLSIGWGAPTDLDDLGSTVYSGGLQYDITPQIGVSLDLSGHKFNNVNTEATSATLHGIYALNQTLALGVFYGTDWINDTSTELYGVEGSYAFIGGDVEGYAGVKGDDTLFGVDGAYRLSQGFSLIGGLDVTSGDTSVNRIAAGAQYQLAGGPSFYAEIGRTGRETAGVSTSDSFVGLGATVAFGNGGGTTFAPRSGFNVSSGF